MMVGIINKKKAYKILTAEEVEKLPIKVVDSYGNFILIYYVISNCIKKYRLFHSVIDNRERPFEVKFINK